MDKPESKHSSMLGHGCHEFHCNSCSMQRLMERLDEDGKLYPINKFYTHSKLYTLLKAFDPHMVWDRIGC